MKTLALSAIICGASILGLNFSTADAATLQSEKINQIADIEQLITYKDSESNRYTGGERARRAIEEAARRDRYNNRYERERQERYERERRERERQERYEKERRERERQERYEKERRERERQERYERERRNKIEHRR